MVAHGADGAVSGEHVDAIVKGIHHIGARAPNPIDDEARFGQVTDLVGQFFGTSLNNGTLVHQYDGSLARLRSVAGFSGPVGIALDAASPSAG